MTTRTAHRWTEEDDIGLLVAIDEVGGLRDHYKRQGYVEAPWWDAVAGRLYVLRGEAIKVTGSACRARFARLNEEEEIEPSARRLDGWERALAIVSEFQAQQLYDLLADLESCRASARDLGCLQVEALLDVILDWLGE